MKLVANVFVVDDASATAGVDVPHDLCQYAGCLDFLSFLVRCGAFPVLTGRGLVVAVHFLLHQVRIVDQQTQGRILFNRNRKLGRLGDDDSLDRRAVSSLRGRAGSFHRLVPLAGFFLHQFVKNLNRRRLIDWPVGSFRPTLQRRSSTTERKVHHKPAARRRHITEIHLVRVPLFEIERCIACHTISFLSFDP